jgi:hypothetical protein
MMPKNICLSLHPFHEIHTLLLLLHNNVMLLKIHQYIIKNGTYDCVIYFAQSGVGLRIMIWCNIT